MQNRLEIKKGDKYNDYTVISEGAKLVQPSGVKVRTIKCKCVCGRIKDVLLVHLVRNRSKSCGCKRRTKNGESNTPIYIKYKSMIERCDKNYKNAHNYYNRGISVCKEWDDFFAFKDWALKNGYRKDLTIDRRDNDKGYSPDNCRFVTCRDNVNNRSNTQMVVYKNKTYPITELFDYCGIKEVNRTAIRRRIKRGWSVDAAFDTPIKQGNYSKKK